VAVEDAQLRIIQEGRSRKFVKKVEQVTFSGAFALSRSQPVIYVTERCVFQLTPDGLDLIEVAPGIDIDRDILAHMDFTPTITRPIVMDRRIFMDGPMDLLSDLLNMKLSERVSYDAERNILFLNLEGWSVRKKSDIEDLKKVLVDACKSAGRRVNSVVNHDGFRLADDLYDEYANLIQYLTEHCYATTTRYTTSTFMRVKMQEALKKRGLKPHIYERPEEAHAILEQQAAE
jgi:propionate CoA-transferase